MAKYLSISELSKKLNLVNSSNKPANYVLRYWEKEFKQIKPKLINKRRYYSSEQVELIKMIKFLLRDKMVSIEGVKKVLNTKINKLDDHDSHSLKASYYKKELKQKSRKILDRISRIKKYGKKNSHKS